MDSRLLRAAAGKHPVVEPPELPAPHLPPSDAEPGAITEPVPRGLASLLRRAVLDHAASERRRGFYPLLHVGLPGGLETVFAVRPDETLDHALRTDVVAAMLRRTCRPGAGGSEPLVWLTRPGELDVQDVDVAWLAATRAAAGELGRPLPFVVANRRSWCDPRTGVTRRWQRLRDRRRTAGGLQRNG